MRICRITSAFPPPWAGLGPGPYELSAAQSELGHEVKVIARYAEGCEGVDGEAPFEVVRLRARRNLSFGLAAALKFGELHRRESFDVVHSHGDSALPLLLLRRLFPRVPVVSSVHIVRKAQFKTLGGLKPGTNGGLPGRVARALELWKERLYIGGSDALAAVSEGLKGDIAGEYGADSRVSVVLNGVNTRRFSPARSGRENQRLKDELGFEPIMLFAGALNGRKGEIDLIEAMRKIAEECPGAGLVVIGDGPARGHARRKSEGLGLSEKIIFLRSVGRNRMADFYLASDLFVLPSYSEGLPKVLLEAMASGTAAVVSDIPAHREVIRDGETGYFFKAGDVEDLARTLLSALEGRERRERVARAARDFVEDRYTWQSVAIRMDRIYDDCRGKRSVFPDHSHSSGDH